jgi:hypothetical protein
MLLFLLNKSVENPHYFFSLRYAAMLEDIVRWKVRPHAGDTDEATNAQLLKQKLEALNSYFPGMIKLELVCLSAKPTIRSTWCDVPFTKAARCCRCITIIRCVLAINSVIGVVSESGCWRAGKFDK